MQREMLFKNDEELSTDKALEHDNIDRKGILL